MKREVFYFGNKYTYLSDVSDELYIYSFDNKRILVNEAGEVILQYFVESVPRFLRIKKNFNDFSHWGKN